MLCLKCIAPIYRTASRVAEITDLRSAHRPREYSLTRPMAAPVTHPRVGRAAPGRSSTTPSGRRARLAEVNSAASASASLRRQSVPAQGSRHSTAHRRTSRARSAAKPLRWCRGCSGDRLGQASGSARSAAEIELLAIKRRFFRASSGLPDLPLEPFGALYVSGLNRRRRERVKWRSDPRADRIPS